MGPNQDNVGEQSTDTPEQPADPRQNDAARAVGPSDWELVNCVRRGDETAFELLFERHKVRVSAIAGRFFQEHVEDIVQECFTRAYFSLSDFSPRDEGSLANWLSKIAFNTCYDELRRRGRRRESQLSDLPEAEAQTLRSLTSGSEHVSLESVAVSRDLANKLLAQLTADDRLVLVMLDVEGLSVREIAETMGWSIAKVKIRVFRARGDLRRLLQKFL
jgi:RNA polymerase sigma-70 factor (ECF subfamily)